MADVNPDKRSMAKEEIEGVLCPEGYAARVHIGGGKINNVYGGNDIFLSCRYRLSSGSSFLSTFPYGDGPWLFRM